MDDDDYLTRKGEKVERHVFRAVAFLCRGSTNKVATTNSVANLAKFTLRNHRTGPYIDENIDDCLEHLAFSGKIVCTGRDRVKLAKPYKDWDIRKMEKSKWSSKVKFAYPTDSLGSLIGNSSSSSLHQIQMRRYTLKGCEGCGLRSCRTHWPSKEEIMSGRYFVNPKRTDYRLNVHSIRNDLAVYNLQNVMKNLGYPQFCDWTEDSYTVRPAIEEIKTVDNGVQTDAQPPTQPMSTTRKILKWFFF